MMSASISRNFCVLATNGSVVVAKRRPRPQAVVFSFAQQMRNRIALIRQFLKRFIHQHTARCINFQTGHARVLAACAGDGNAVLDALRNAVAAVGWNAHRDPFAVCSERPIAHVIDGGVGGGSGGR